MRMPVSYTHLDVYKRQLQAQYKKELQALYNTVKHGTELLDVDAILHLSLIHI